MIEKAQFSGDNPMARFGHTITPIGKDKAILFGGAVGDTGKYVITNDTFVCDYYHKKWKKLQSRGMPPSNRAAHCSVVADHYLYVYGGALGGGQLADDALYQLDFHSLNDKAYWGVKNCNGGSPGGRYGHVMAFLTPYIIIHGGNIGNQPVGDLWALDIVGNCIWKKIDLGNTSPPARAYHSASMCKTGTANGMMVIFGGRGTDQSSLNDTWGLRRHRDGRLDWMQAPYKNNAKPAQRYQHRTLFIGTLLMIVGGRNNQVGDSMPLDIYDTDSSEWYQLPSIERFRHACFLIDGSLFIQGGFDQTTPSVPTDLISKIDLSKAFAKQPALFKILAFELGHDIITHNPQNINSKCSNKNSKQKQIIQDQRNFHTGSYNNKKQKINNEQRIKRDTKTTNKSIRLCPQAVVANFDQAKDIKKIQIDQLPTQNKRLVNNINLSCLKQQNQKVYRFFLNNLFCRPTAHIAYPIPGEYLQKLLDGIQKIVQEEPTLLKLRAPVKVFGDIHGQVHELNRFFQAFGPPSDQMQGGDIQFTNYLFLGDYIDRGNKSVESILLLFALKLKYPDNILLLRGSHQDRLINKSMGFGDQCIAKFKQNIDDQNSFFSRCNKIFDKLPLAAVIDDNFFCVHGGIGATLKNIKQLDDIQRPIKVSHTPKSKTQKIVYELLWTDHCNQNDNDYAYNEKHDYLNLKINFKFSEQRANSFCNDNDLVSIIRSHQPIMDGYQQTTQSIFTVFSCSDYGGSGNKAGIIHVKKNSQIGPKMLNSISNKDKWMNLLQLGRKNQMINQQDSTLRSISFTPVKK